MTHLGASGALFNDSNLKSKFVMGGGGIKIICLEEPSGVGVAAQHEKVMALFKPYKL